MFALPYLSAKNFVWREQTLCKSFADCLSRFRARQSSARCPEYYNRCLGQNWPKQRAILRDKKYLSLYYSDEIQLLPEPETWQKIQKFFSKLVDASPCCIKPLALTFSRLFRNLAKRKVRTKTATSGATSSSAFVISTYGQINKDLTSRRATPLVRMYDFRLMKLNHPTKKGAENRKVLRIDSITHRPILST
jgi:hypothetical protein